MTSAHHRLGDGLSCPAIGFPAGMCQKREGHWLVAQKTENRVANRRKKETYFKCKSTEADHLTLDALFLLQLHHVDDPSQICSVDISERKLNSVNPEDFQVFKNIAYIDASINSLSLAHSLTLPAGEEHVNILRSIQEVWETSRLPLPELQILNLADNKIVKEEALLAAALFPKLLELDIHSNPLTTKRKGDPPLLAFYLQERQGIRIKRKKPEEPSRLCLKASAGHRWKVEGSATNVSKRPMIIKEATSGDRKKISGSVPEKTEPFFITQAEDDPAENKRRRKTNTKQSPSCEMRMDLKTNPDVLKSVGIQTAVRMLDYTLRNLNVYPDSKPDGTQTQRRDRTKKMRILPPLRSVKQPTERVDAMLKQIKDSSSMTVVSFGSALNTKGVDRKEQREAQDAAEGHEVKVQEGPRESSGTSRRHGVWHRVSTCSLIQCCSWDFILAFFR
ncbi:X-ray radiation resistance-associated protein 1 [Oryzias melastigma]|uniref:X-ray radiation resistance-associated protein 1 n=1 Tax=Oryzias melastigma TaxID=30732 RepID=A0A834FCA6_ORYME|nr:X-ray radiation resistance-associated protein 1 [Oryzias melastigma]